MSKRKKKNNNLIVILIIIIVLIVIFAFLVNAIKKETTKKEEISQDEIITNYTPDVEYEETMNVVKEQFEEIGQIVPENYNFLTRMYEGNVTDTVLYSKIYNFIRKIVPETYKELKDADESLIISYFNTNKETIYSDLGINTEEDYLNLVKKIKEIGDKEYLSSSFDVSKFETKNKYSKVPLIIQYEGVSISIDVCVINNENDNLPIVCLGASQVE